MTVPTSAQKRKVRIVISGIWALIMLGVVFGRNRALSQLATTAAIGLALIVTPAVKDPEQPIRLQNLARPLKVAAVGSLVTAIILVVALAVHSRPLLLAGFIIGPAIVVVDAWKRQQLPHK